MSVVFSLRVREDEASDETARCAEAGLASRKFVPSLLALRLPVVSSRTKKIYNKSPEKDMRSAQDLYIMGNRFHLRHARQLLPRLPRPVIPFDPYSSPMRTCWVGPLQHDLNRHKPRFREQRRVLLRDLQYYREDLAASVSCVAFIFFAS